MTMHTLSWDELADAVLTHDPELQHHAWHATCEPLTWRAHDTQPRSRAGIVEYAVEQILHLRYENDDHDVAVAVLRGYRPDLTVEQIEQWITDLLDRAEWVRQAESSGSLREFEACRADYEETLHQFVTGAVS